MANIYCGHVFQEVAWLKGREQKKEGEREILERLLGMKYISFSTLSGCPKIQSYAETTWG